MRNYAYHINLVAVSVSHLSLWYLPKIVLLFMWYLPRMTLLHCGIIRRWLIILATRNNADTNLLIDVGYLTRQVRCATSGPDLKTALSKQLTIPLLIPHDLEVFIQDLVANHIQDLPDHFTSKPVSELQYYTCAVVERKRGRLNVLCTMNSSLISLKWCHDGPPMPEYARMDHRSAEH